MTAGRPTEYRDEFAGQAEKLCRLGATDMELADFFEVDTRTIYRWKHKHDEFCQAMKVGKDALDDRVERSLFQRAVGTPLKARKSFRFKAVSRALTVSSMCRRIPGLRCIG